jgi:hypothetical protein
MKRRALIKFAALAVLLFSRVGANATTPPNDLQAYKNVIEFVKSLLGAADKLADAVDRERLIAYLERLLGDFRNMEYYKKEIATLIGQNPVPRDQIYEAAEKLLAEVTVAQQDLGKVPFQFGQELAHQGQQVGQELSNAFSTKEIWLRQLLASVHSTPNLSGFAEDARTSLSALNSADDQLSTFISTLKKS